MNIYNTLIIILLIFLFICLFVKKSMHIDKILIFIIAFLLIYVASNRALDVGTDTSVYFSNFQSIEFEGSSRTYQGLQIGWYYFNLFIYQLFNYDTFMYIVYTILIGFVCYVSYKESKYPLLSILLFVLLYFYFHSFNGMRQYIAISILFYGYSFLSKGDKKKYLFSVCIASLFHFTAVLMLPLLYIEKIKISPIIVYFSVIVSFIIGIVFSDLLTGLVPYFAYLSVLNEGVSDYLDNYGGERSFFSNFVINLVYLITFYFSKDKRNTWLILYLLFILSNNLLGAGGFANRIFWYFQIGMLIAIPNTLKNIKPILLRSFYFIIILIYSFAIYYSCISTNVSEVVPYNFR